MNWNFLQTGSNSIWVAVGLLATATLIAVLVFLVPSRVVTLDRRRFGVTDTPSSLTRVTDASAGLIARILSRKDGSAEEAAHALDLAGIRRSVPEFILLVGAATIVSAALGSLVGGVITGFLLGLMTLVGAFLFVNFRAGKRRNDFAEQLDDFVQLLGSNLRAGHSVLQAMDSITHELEEPGASEVARVVNQVRVGRDLGEALDEAAERMKSDDFSWVSQAIAIHRRVGGNLADVMDTVGETIRERNQIRRQVRSLSAEGRMSAYVLIGLPIAVALALTILNPEYIGRLGDGVVGLMLILAAVVLMSIGAFWISKIVKIQF